MAKLTDYVRAGFRKRGRPWDGAEVPDWWTVAVWGALVMIGAILLFGAVFNDPKPAGRTDPGKGKPVFQVQKVNPYSASPPTPAPGATTAGPGADGRSGPNAGDYAATAPVQLPRVGGGTVTVPSGARAVALAAATATATGDWSGVPLAGPGPKAAPRTPQGSLVGALTAVDPAQTGTSSYVFNAMIRHGPAMASYRVLLNVEQVQAGYAVRLR